MELRIGKGGTWDVERFQRRIDISKSFVFKSIKINSETLFYFVY